MTVCSIESLLRPNPYPGRGIIIGRSEDGLRSIIAYFIMGRSENSRNRVFAMTEDGIRTRAFDPAKLTDPTLVIYHPVRVLRDGRTIVTNGDQTDTIHAYLRDGKTFRDALLTREFEPDPPNYTPRISGLAERGGRYELSILKSPGGALGCWRYFFEYSEAVPGLGHLITTYMGDGDPLPSFEGEPRPVSIAAADGLESFAKSLWDALNTENRVSLYARETVIATGEARQVIINKNTREGEPENE